MLQRAMGVELALGASSTDASVSQLAGGIERVHWAVWLADNGDALEAHVLIEPSEKSRR